jgi:hypothetical protein
LKAAAADLATAIQPAAAVLKHSESLLAAILITNNENYSNQLAEANSDAESLTQHSRYMYALAAQVGESSIFITIASCSCYTA